MSENNQKEINMNKSIATGAQLTKDTFDDFIKRLKTHHQVESELTSDPIFQVREKYSVWGADGTYSTDGNAYIVGETPFFTREELINSIIENHDLSSNEQKEISDQLNEYDFLEEVRKYEPSCFVGYYKTIDRVICSHFTREAAEAFIKRKQHDYQELFVYVESSHWCWEFNEIVKALLDGRLVYDENMDKSKATSSETHYRLGSKLDHSNTPALQSVIKEMYLQDAKWGADRNHHDFVWNAILTEEVGEFAEAILHAEFGGPKSLNRRLEAVQIAAVALQIVEYLDRQSEIESQNR